MRGLASIVAAAGLTVLPGPAASITLSSHRAGVRPVQVLLRLGYEMQCGWPGPQIDLVFPSAEQLPTKIPRNAVIVNGKTPQSVHLAGRTLTIAIARPAGVMCDVIGPGRAGVELMRAAGIGNPRRRGTYTLIARHGTTAARVSFTIT